MQHGLERVWAAVKGARKIEWIALLALAAVAVLLMNGVEKQTAQSPQKTDLELRMESVLSSVKGAGKVRVLVSERPKAQTAFSGSGETLARGTEIEGVVVVAEGAEELRVALELARAVQALLGIELDQIEILKMEG